MDRGDAEQLKITHHDDSIGSAVGKLLWYFCENGQGESTSMIYLLPYSEICRRRHRVLCHLKEIKSHSGKTSFHLFTTGQNEGTGLWIELGKHMHPTHLNIVLYVLVTFFLNKKCHLRKLLSVVNHASLWKERLQESTHIIMYTHRANLLDLFRANIKQKLSLHTHMGVCVCEHCDSSHLWLAEQFDM